MSVDLCCPYAIPVPAAGRMSVRVKPRSLSVDAELVSFTLTLTPNRNVGKPAAWNFDMEFAVFGYSVLALPPA
jgi:hypothetical protein